MIDLRATTTPRRGDNQRLGIYAKLSSTSELKTRQWRDDFKKKQSVNRTKAGKLLPDFRVRKCGKHKIPKKQIEIRLDRATHTAHWSGIQTCASVWVCPVCAAKISARRKPEIEEAIKTHEACGGKVLFVTLTFQHERNMSLNWGLKRSKAALGFVRSGRRWQQFKKKTGFVGYIEKTEITWGFNSGWHVHYHLLFFVANDVDIEAAEDELYERWSYALEREDLETSRERGVHVRDVDEQTGEYMTKTGAEWAIGDEITNNDRKTGRNGHYTQFQLLDLYTKGELWAGSLFQEFGVATKGLSSLRWSRGLRKILEMGKEATDEELAGDDVDEGRDIVVIAELTQNQLTKLIYSGRPGVLGEALTVAERGRDALLLWLEAYFNIHPPPD